MKAAPLFQVPFHLVACIEANLLNSGEKLMQAGVVFESRKIPVVPQAGFLIYIYIYPISQFFHFRLVGFH